MAIYVKIGDIKGDATHANHTDWIECQSVQWGVGRSIMTNVGGAANREASQPSLSELTVSKTLDQGSTSLFISATTGNVGEKLELHMVTTGSPGDTYVEITLTNVLVSGYSFSSGGDRPSESISFNYTALEFKQNLFDEAHNVKTSLTEKYDLATAEKG